VLQRGGVVGGAGAAARALGALVDEGGGADAKTVRGFGLLPDTVLAPGGTLQRERRLFGVLDKNPGLLGLGIDDGAVLTVHGRSLRVGGEGAVSACLAAAPGRAARRIEIKADSGHDFTALRRAAIARAEPPFPPKEVVTPEVPKGALLIVGGGGMPEELVKKFIALAGGPDAPIVVLPTANPDPIPAKADAGFFERAGAKNVQVLRGRERQDVEDPKALEALKNAKAIWFGGGRQWRFVDAYEGTKAHELFRDVLRRGGVIGGSSAGATIQGDYLCRGSPLNNTEMMSEGYERGLGFLPGVAIDQHFTQRKRFADLTALVKTYPQLLGIGIDESTAILVQGHTAEVMGRNQVHFYDRNKPVAEGKPDYETVKPGGRYDLKARKVLEAGR
jgi:cyanophycinase